MPYSLTRQVSLLSNELRSAGYSTHLIGKWHLGFQAWKLETKEYTPTYRGFDTFSGFYAGEEDYFTHIAAVKDTDLSYYDLRNGEEEDHDAFTYSVYKHRDQFLSLINSDTNLSNPFFIYLAFQAAHYPSECPLEYTSKYCDNVIGECTDYQIHQAQITSIDDAMQIIVNGMKAANIWNNTLLVFSSDNGGAINSGDNAPLRGFKTTPFEGGVRVPGFVSGGYLNEERKGQRLNAFAVHATDWYPTLLSAAGIDVTYKISKRVYSEEFIHDIDAKLDEIVIPLDGTNIWNAIQNGVIGDDELLEREILLHLDPIDCPFDACGALRFGKWKYIRSLFVCGDGFEKCGWNNAFMVNPTQNILECLPNDGTVTDDCSEGCLFDLDNDPCEYFDIKEENQDIVDLMQQRLRYWQSRSVAPLMGINPIILDDDKVRPTVVCNSTFWCPYQKYNEVEFEYLLKDEYKRLYAVKSEEFEFETVLFLFTIIGICIVISCKLLDYQDGNEQLLYEETSPLIK